MRQTFTTLQTQAQNYCGNDTSAATLTFLNTEINLAKRFVFAELSQYISQMYKTATSVANQQYYHLPIDCADIVAAQITIAGIGYPLEAKDSEESWMALNSITFQGTTIPKYFFQRKHDVGFWPIPQDTTWTIS